MRFGKRENNNLTKSCQYIFTLFIFCSCAFSVACQSREQKIDAALKKCQELLDKDNLAQAHKCYLQVGKTYPENDSYIVDTSDKAIFKKCGEWKDKGDFENAAVCYEGLTTVRPDNANIRLLLAHSYYKYVEILSSDTRDGEKIKIFLEKAESAVKKGLEIKPNDAWGITIYGDILERKGKTTEALLKYQQAVKLEPKSELYWIKLARAQELNYPKAAIDSYKQALAVNPNSEVTLYYLGQLYEREFEICKAVETFKKLSTLDSNFDDTNRRLKNLYERFDIDASCQEKSKLNEKKDKSKLVTGTPNKPQNRK